MINFLLWYFTITIVGLMTFPLAYKFLGNLPDKGYTLSRVLGLLIWGFSFWILTSLQILQNDQGGIVFALLILLLASGVIFSQHKKALLSWIAQHKKIIITSELLFFLMFVVWTIVRAANPEISGTEKPMEIAFINAILRSETFPPHDPWLSGYSISYYYFGYVLIAMLTRFTGVLPEIAFNLTSSMWFALTGLASYGLVYNLLAADWQKKATIIIERSQEYLWGLLGPLFILIVSNLEGFFEILHARGLFWQHTQDGILTSSFWKWLNILELNSPPAEPFTWAPNRPTGIVWWRASRVLSDLDMAGHVKEIIDEFPFFSYLLADLHPHVLAMPFVMLSIGVALNLYLRGFVPHASDANIFEWIFARMQGKFVPASEVGLFNRIRGYEFWLAALVLGSLAFFNTWDFPFYVALYCSADVFLKYKNNGWNRKRIFEFIELGLALGIAGFLLYMPFYIGFSSQAGGILPSLSFYTRGVHFWIMFGQFLIPLLGLVFWAWRSKKIGFSARNGLKFSVGVILGLWLFSYFFGGVILALAEAGKSSVAAGEVSTLYSSFERWGSLFYGLHGSSDVFTLLIGSFARRISSPGTWLTLLILLIFVWGFLTAKAKTDGLSIEADQTETKGFYFVLLLMLLGCGLAIAPEYIYLRDQFGWRMNTIFKFYFQVWMLWGISAAYASALLWREMKSVWGGLYKGLWSIVILMSLCYPVFALDAKTNGFNTAEWTLNGLVHIERYNPGDVEAIHWLREVPLATIVEAVGGSYSSYERVSAHSGMPTVLGWPGHESQWRGGAQEMGSRETDIQKLYVTKSWDEARSILEAYDIKYVYIGSLERSKYQISEVKFQRYLEPVFETDGVIIYQVPDDLQK